MMRLNKCGSGELLGAERTIGSREDYWRQRGLLRTFSVLFPYSLITVHGMNCDRFAQGGGCCAVVRCTTSMLSSACSFQTCQRNFQASSASTRYENGVSGPTFCTIMIFLPRQARDKDRENSTTNTPSEQCRAVTSRWLSTSSRART